jgi:hypothetical protein
MSERTFVDRCIEGIAFLTDIDDFVDAWHDGDYNQPIWDFLGMKENEYELWVERPESLRFIVAAHRQHVAVGDVLQARGPNLIAARADNPDDADRVIKWLRQTGRLS